MEKELNYLSEKIEKLTQDRDYREREVAVMGKSKLRYDINESIIKLNTEIELLDNILSVVTQNALS